MLLPRWWMRLITIYVFVFINARCVFNLPVRFRPGSFQVNGARHIVVAFWFSCPDSISTGGRSCRKHSSAFLFKTLPVIAV